MLQKNPKIICNKTMRIHIEERRGNYEKKQNKNWNPTNVTYGNFYTRKFC